ncbi:MAG: hypothetical protein ACHQ49_18280 [Elusimicrobiota bacterium]
MKQVIQTMKQDIGTLKADVVVLKTDVSVLKTDVSVLKTDVSVLKTDVSVLKTDVSALRATTTKIAAEVSRIDGQIGDLATRAEMKKGFGDVLGRFDDFASEIKASRDQRRLQDESFKQAHVQLTDHELRLYRLEHQEKS